MRLFRKSRRSKKVKDASQVASVVTHSDRRGAHGRAVRTPWIDGQLGMKLSQSTLHMTPSTSKQMAGLALAEAAPPTGNHGILLGVDVTTGSAVVHDPFVAYREESGFSSPNGVIFGDLGFGKSQLAKAWIIRNLAFGRRVIAVDKKRQEYTDGRQHAESVESAKTAPVPWGTHQLLCVRVVEGSRSTSSIPGSPVTPVTGSQVSRCSWRQ